MPECFVVSDNARGLSETTKHEGTVIVPIITRLHCVFCWCMFCSCRTLGTEFYENFIEPCQVYIQMKVLEEYIEEQHFIFK